MLGLHRLLRRWHARKGRLVVLPSVPSPELDNRRDLYIYVPAAPARGDSRYPVIYMQDGQNLFDPALSFAGTWGVDEALSWTSRRGLDAIVVGIPNMRDARIAEYDPFMGTGDRYLDFVTHTVKPIVDAQFPTLPDRRHTGIAGSSMGGLISLYAFFRYSESFGFAADRRMDRPGVLGEHLENGWIQMFCLHHVHEESWYGEHLHPGARAWRHLQYDRYLRDEVIPFSTGQNPNPFVIAVGASFGAYHAACFGLRNPHLVNRIIGLSGLYDITRLTGDRKSTRLNSSHGYISYAVFCLKKKNHTTHRHADAA